MRGLDAYLQPPDPEPVECLTHGTDECDGEQDDCERDDGCFSCGAEVSRLCYCDEAYERSRELDDDFYFD